MTRTVRGKMVWRVGQAPVFLRRRGFGGFRGFGATALPASDPNSVYNTDCGPGFTLDPGPPAHCILSSYASRMAPVVLSYPQAPGCNVGDLSRNLCYYDDGTEGGCNSMPECDSLTGARHVEYGLPGGPTNVGIPIQVGVPPSSGPVFAPNRLTNPSGGTVIPMPSASPAQIQASTVAALGKDLANKFYAALGIPIAGSSTQQSASSSVASGGGSSQQTQSPSQQGGGSSQQSGGSSQTTTPGSISDLVSSPVNLFGLSFPAWGLAAAALFAVFAFSGRGK